jgi:hypothetical protein
MLEAFLHHARLAVELQDMKQGPGQLPPDADERLRDPLFQLGLMGDGSVWLALKCRIGNPSARSMPFEQLRPRHLQPSAACLMVRYSQADKKVHVLLVVVVTGLLVCALCPVPCIACSILNGGHTDI